MTRRPKKRQAQISYRPPTGLSEEFRTRGRNSGLSINAYITSSVFGQAAPRAARTPPLDQKLAAQLLSQAPRLNDGLGEIGPTGAHTIVLQECRDELAQNRNCP